MGTPGREDPGFLTVGRLGRPHGIDGEMMVWPLTDHPESTFAPGVVLLPGDDAPDAELPPLEIVGSRPFQQGWLVTFEGVDTRTEAETLRGCYLYRTLGDVEPLAEGEVFQHELLGLEVVTLSGEAVGKVTEIYETRPADLLEVRGTGGTHMIPLTKDIVVDIDLAGGRLVVDPPEGLLDL
jgi:16S rRNA processing protein RimM